MIGIYYNTGSEAKSADWYQVFAAAYVLIIMQINRIHIQQCVRKAFFPLPHFQDLDLRTKPCYLIRWSFYAPANELLRESIFLFFLSADATFGESKRLSPAHFIQLLFIPCIISLTRARAPPRNSSAKICSTLSLEARPQSHCLLLSAHREREMTICTSYFTLFNETWGNYRADTAPNTYMCIRSRALFLL